ncbi:hypothetical protein D3C75_1304050 [compost metagenome]
MIVNLFLENIHHGSERHKGPPISDFNLWNGGLLIMILNGGFQLLGIDANRSTELCGNKF